MDNLTLTTTITTITDTTDMNNNDNDRDAKKQNSTNSLDDAVCRASVSSVREIIKKYEPNHMIGNDIKRGSYGSIKSLKSKSVNHSQSQTSDCYGETNSREIVNHHIVYEDQQTVMMHNEPVQEFSPRRTVYRANEVQNSGRPQQQHPSYRDAVVRRNQSNEEFTRSSNPSRENKCISVKGYGSFHKIPNTKNPNSTDNSYQSKTTISKTANGVRIITDIFFDANTDYNWQGSRIETDIPPSKILKEFQDKNY